MVYYWQSLLLKLDLPVGEGIRPLTVTGLVGFPVLLLYLFFSVFFLSHISFQFTLSRFRRLLLSFFTSYTHTYSFRSFYNHRHAAFPASANLSDRRRSLQTVQCGEEFF
ncbi:hypothetical protein L1987_35630 [Smallanthus sonchifolius]|uniref:Uncharacterized protein n=1 Tax=Smallanthus sonchifolius TaxID=185202 RepID=A0ACB9HC54_9ASTR|nr:hypothetical protein L1987_35630 [Smallanthus sonchifolius]